MNNYNSIAFCYQFIVNAIFGKSLLRAQENYIALLPNNGNLLIIGGGHGEILKTINRLKPNLKIDYIDQSEKMVSSAKKIAKIGTTEFIIGDEHSIPNKSYDAVITFFFLDLFQEIRRTAIIKLLKNQLKENGLWLVADFNVPRNWKQRLIEKIMFLFLKITTQIESDKIENYRGDLSQVQLSETSTATFYNDFVFSSVFIKDFSKS